MMRSVLSTSELLERKSRIFPIKAILNCSHCNTKCNHTSMKVCLITKYNRSYMYINVTEFISLISDNVTLNCLVFLTYDLWLLNCI